MFHRELVDQSKVSPLIRAYLGDALTFLGRPSGSGVWPSLEEIPLAGRQMVLSPAYALGLSSEEQWLVQGLVPLLGSLLPGLNPLQPAFLDAVLAPGSTRYGGALAGPAKAQLLCLPVAFPCLNPLLLPSSTGNTAGKHGREPSSRGSRHPDRPRSSDDNPAHGPRTHRPGPGPGHTGTFCLAKNSGALGRKNQGMPGTGKVGDLRGNPLFVICPPISTHPRQTVGEERPPKPIEIAPPRAYNALAGSPQLKLPLAATPSHDRRETGPTGTSIWRME